MKWLGWTLAGLAIATAAWLAWDVATHGTPSILPLLLAAAFVGSAAAWPVAQESQGLPCMECGHLAFASSELGFCAHCGSQRVWRAVRADGS